MEPFVKYLLTVDKDMNVVSAEESFLTYIGRDSIQNLDQVVPPQDMMQLRNAVFAIDPGSLGLSCFRIRTSEGRLNWIACNVEKKEGREDVSVMELSDIQTLKSEGALSHYDEMTGLLNKQSITDLAMTLTRAYPRKRFYFCLMDIDHFKNVNDSFGHMCGDEVIIDVAHIIRDCVGTNGMVGRIGGDEFMLVLEKVEDKPKAREILANIRESVETKYKDFKNTMSITVSIGTGLYPDYASDYDELFHLADKMLYLAKVKGRNRYIIYTPEIHGDIHAEVKVTTTTSHAASEVDKQQMMLHFLSHFLHTPDISIQMAIEKVLVAYDLDELYIFYEKSPTSRYGIVRKDLEDGKFEIAQEENEMPILRTPMFRRMFNENHVAIVNLYDLNRERDPDLLAYMERNERRFMVVYHMEEARKKGYIVYCNKRDSSCRLSESDIADLVYFGRMVELTSSDR